MVGTKDVDTLSTIALGLAILAFVAQLIVSLAQGMSGAQQVMQAERINADTQSALAALRATSDALLVTQREHFSKVLTAALARAVPEAVDETLAEVSGESGQAEATPEQLDQLQAAILARVEDLLDRSPRFHSKNVGSRLGAPDPLYFEFARKPDPGRVRDLMEIYQSLSPRAQSVFHSAANRAIRAAREGSRNAATHLKLLSSGTIPDAHAELQEKGLISLGEVRQRDGAASTSYRITPLGVEVARLQSGGYGHEPRLLPHP
ncbi:hypothetical protein [Verrucosispora sp. WMMD1129]|uniref:hypothetical protein n=1 Tax=Verrucosispora sp. WMMD1129 TaxID=3016093 RepID=UPI00249B4F12|nr:hypothetical protein [Verrucosispora sp. WMMD1129]WFE47128.1 hypothetical protein O7624_23745 [Verrucosispora sp. WMMD1129]